MIMPDNTMKTDYRFLLYRENMLVGDEKTSFKNGLAKIIASLYQTNNEHCIDTRWISCRKCFGVFRKKRLYFKTIYPNYIYELRKLSAGDIDEAEVTRVIEELRKDYERQLRLK